MADIDYSQYLVTKPFQGPAPAKRVSNLTYPPLTLYEQRSGAGGALYVEFGWVWGSSRA